MGGVNIKVAPGAIQRERFDAIDRTRAFDNSYRASVTGTPKRDWMFDTAPVSRADADFYEMVLAQVSPINAWGDIIGIGSNQLLWSEDFVNAVWTKSSITVTPGISDPMGGTLAHTLTATAINSFISQSLAAGGSITRTNSLWLRRRTGVGAVELLDPGNLVWTALSVTGTWTRFPATNPAPSVQRIFALRLVTSGDAVDAYGAQLEDGAAATQYRKTTTAAVGVATAAGEAGAISCIPEITGWSPVRTAVGHRVVLSFVLHEV